MMLFTLDLCNKTKLYDKYISMMRDVHIFKDFGSLNIFVKNFLNIFALYSLNCLTKI